MTHDGTSVGSMVTYECVIGHELTGYNMSYCGLFGEWDKPQPECKRK